VAYFYSLLDFYLIITGASDTSLSKNSCEIANSIGLKKQNSKIDFGGLIGGLILWKTKGVWGKCD